MRRPMMAGIALLAALASRSAEEVQLTRTPHGHVLTNVNVWSPDAQWIAYDVRTGDRFDGDRIERVNVRTGEVRLVYASRAGAKCGVVTYHPSEAAVVFILGPERPTPDWDYASSRRRGVLVDVERPDDPKPLDAMNYAPPFVPGALRGGSHVHVFSPDGAWISFTYDDDVLSRLDARSDAPPHEPNQRNVGVMVPSAPVRVARSHPRNHDGGYFAAIVSRTVASPEPGSDEIVRACEEGWVGRSGYTRADGTQQHRALAFQGTVVAANGSRHAEVFLLDLPADATQPGDGPLQGTEWTRPAPPQDVRQRRLTFTAASRFPGVATSPRHWLRASPDGSQIAFLMRDDEGVVQLWTVSPQGGSPRRVTRNVHPIASAFTWSPDGKGIAHVMDGSVCVTDMPTGETRRLTRRREGEQAPSALACVYSPDGKWIAYTRNVPTDGAAFAQVFVVAAP